MGSGFDIHLVNSGLSTPKHKEQPQAHLVSE